MPVPPDSHQAQMRLALGQLEDAISPADAAKMAGLLTGVAGVLCAYAAADGPGGELLAQVHGVACAPAPQQDPQPGAPR